MTNFKQALEQAVHEATAFAQSVQDLDLEALRSRLPIAALQQADGPTAPFLSMSLFGRFNELEMPDLLGSHW